MNARVATLAALLQCACSHAPPVLPANWDTLQASVPAGRCKPARTERWSDIDAAGNPVFVYQRVRCGVVELRLVVRPDDLDGRVRELFRDRDHDGEFEEHQILDADTSG